MQFFATAPHFGSRWVGSLHSCHVVFRFIPRPICQVHLSFWEECFPFSNSPVVTKSVAWNIALTTYKENESMASLPDWEHHREGKFWRGDETKEENFSRTRKEKSCQICNFGNENMQLWKQVILFEGIKSLAAVAVPQTTEQGCKEHRKLN